MAKYSKYVYAVDTATGNVLDTAKNEATMAKRLSLKKKPFPETIKFYKVDIQAPITQINTDELTGYYNLKYALDAAIAVGTAPIDALANLEAAGRIVVANCN